MSTEVQKEKDFELSKVDVFAQIDRAEAALVSLDNPVDCPVTHKFTPGLYIREIFMPAGTLLTSKIHNTCHPFVISKGACSVFNAENGETVELSAPYCGVTKPGTRRVIYIFEDTIWTTFHPIPHISGRENELSEEDKNELVEVIESEIITAYHNPLLQKEINV